MKESFPYFTVQGPNGPYEVLRTETVPNLFVFQANSGWTSMAGDTRALKRLSRFADLAGSRRDTVVYLPVRVNGAPEPIRPWIQHDHVLDLVLAPKHLALTAHGWKEIRSRKAMGLRQVSLQPLDENLKPSKERLEYHQATRGMDRHVGCATLVLCGDPTTFRALAAAAAWISPSWTNWDEYHLDWIQRDDERDVAILFYDPARDGE